MLDPAEIAGRLDYQTPIDPFTRPAEIEALFMPRLLKHTADEWFVETERLRLPIVPVRDMAALLAEPVHRGRGAFGEVRIGAVGGAASASAPDRHTAGLDRAGSPGGRAQR